VSAPLDTRISELERAAAGHWRGTEEEPLGGWLLRAAEGFTGRANSALALGDPGLPLDEALAVVTDWYRARGLPPMVAVPAPLDAPAELDDLFTSRRWFSRPGPAYVMVADLAKVPAARELPDGLETRVDDEPDAEWLRIHRYRGQSDLPPVRLKVLMSADRQAFVSIRSTGAAGSSGTGVAVAVGRLSLGDGWAGITAVEVDSAQRRRGLGTAITLAICAAARARGVAKIFLQVEAGNDAAKSLYERCDFTYSHRYDYRLPPA
jgi:ribosomal protein S18 acetylase RimI-like enzyme